MAGIYIVSNVGKISKNSETFVFSQPDGTSTILFPFKTEIIFVVGKITITGDALRMFSKYRIPVVFLSSNGRFNSKLVYGDSKNVFLRQKQYEILASEAKSLSIAKSIVSGKIKNQISFMQRIKRKKESGVLPEKTIQEKVVELKNILGAINNVNSLESLRGYEGLASKKYFEVFGLNISTPWADFPKRSKNPPETNVNAVLSFLYTLLMYWVETALESTGMDIMVGTLHSCDYGRNSLVFDLMEEFRTPVADTVCCSLFNLEILKQEDFHTVFFDNENEDYPAMYDESRENSDLEKIPSVKGVLLTQEGLKKVVKAFEEKMLSGIFYGNSKIPYKKVIISQVLSYKRVISGEEKEYKSFYFK